MTLEGLELALEKVELFIVTLVEKAEYEKEGTIKKITKENAIKANLIKEKLLSRPIVRGGIYSSI